MGLEPIVVATDATTTPTPPGRRAEGQGPAAPGTALAPHARHGRAAGPAQAEATTGLGNTADNSSTLRQTPEDQAKEAAARARRNHRYRLRAMLWDESWNRRLRNCGRVPIKDCAEVGIVPGPRPGIAGVQRCASPSSCPVCAASIGSRRREELGQVLEWAHRQGYDIALVTLTVRHHRRHRLETLWDATGEAWEKVTSGRAWAGESQAAYRKRVRDHFARWREYLAGDRPRPPRSWRPSPRRIGLAEKFGVVGWARAFEAPHGERNGWHPHLHCVMILDPKAARVPELTDRAAGLDLAELVPHALGIGMHGIWSATLERLGFESWADSGGLDVRVVAATDEQAVADYLLKGLSAEMTLGLFKDGNASRTPFEILHDLGKDGDADDLDLWHEWERTAHGRRLVTWSQGLRELAAVEVKEDEAIIAEETDGTDDAVLVSAADWTAGLNRRTPELIEAAVLGAAAVCLLLDQWGVPWTIGPKPKPPAKGDGTTEACTASVGEAPLF